jgi:hypothetical protein
VHNAAHVGEFERLDNASSVDGEVIDHHLVDDRPDLLVLWPVNDERN